MVTAEKVERTDLDAGARELDGFVRLRLRGPITAARAAEVRDFIRRCVAAGDTRVLIDLQAVTALDACGIAVLLEGTKRVALEENGALVLLVNRTVSRALKASGTVSAFRVWTDCLA
jgi:anti-anti-sigma factor